MIDTMVDLPDTMVDLSDTMALPEDKRRTKGVQKEDKRRTKGGQKEDKRRTKVTQGQAPGPRSPSRLNN